jgi:ATP-dependent protease ClpP protease subunit
MSKKFYNMILNKVTNTGEVDLFGSIGETFWGDGVTAKGFRNDLESLGSVANIKVNISSLGGDVVEGMAIHSMLKNHSATVTTEIYGTAASMGSVIFMAGDVRRAPKNSMFMAHKPLTEMRGNADQLRARADVLDKHQKALSQAYLDHVAMSDEEMNTFLAEEKYLTGEEALSMGFATELGEDLEIAASADESKVKMEMFELRATNGELQAQADALYGQVTAVTGERDELTLKAAELQVKLDDLVDEDVVMATGQEIVLACKEGNLEIIATGLIEKGVTAAQLTSAVASASMIHGLCASAGIEDSSPILAELGNPNEMVRHALIALAADTPELDAKNDGDDTTPEGKVLNSSTVWANRQKSNRG